MTLSDTNDFFESKAFSEWQKLQEAPLKLGMATINRLDAIQRTLSRRHL